jgi:CBS-domain-containing membrane protein
LASRSRKSGGLRHVVWGAPKVLATRDLTVIRVWTSVIAMVLTAAVIVLLRASHPPAGSTALLVALGSFSTWRDVITVIAGVAIVGILGEVLTGDWLRRKVQRQPEFHRQALYAAPAL